MKIQRINKETGGTEDVVTNREIKTLTFYPYQKDATGKTIDVVLKIQTRDHVDEDLRIVLTLSELRRLVATIESGKGFQEAGLVVKIVKGRK